MDISQYTYSIIMTYEIQAIMMAAAVFVCSGLVYSLAGYKAKVYKYLNSDPDVQFDIRRITKKIGLGIFLGLAVFVTEDLVNGEQQIAITEPGVFVKQVIFNVGAIYAFDKLMFAGKGGVKLSGGKADTPTHAELPADDTPTADDFEHPLGDAPPDVPTFDDEATKPAGGA